MVTKRQLGIFVIVVAVLGLLGLLGADLLGVGRWGGFGPLQKTVLGLDFVALVVGFVLVRLGDRPA
jgi:hypothetical protein